jgi:hypothetical protein
MVTTREALRIACHWKEIEDDGRLACAIRHADGQSCTIVLVEDAMMRQYGLNSGILLRHEIGHCNGSDNDHAGDRRG